MTACSASSPLQHCLFDPRARLRAVKSPMIGLSPSPLLLSVPLVSAFSIMVCLFLCRGKTERKSWSSCFLESFSTLRCPWTGEFQVKIPPGETYFCSFSRISPLLGALKDLGAFLLPSSSTEIPGTPPAGASWAGSSCLCGERKQGGPSLAAEGVWLLLGATVCFLTTSAAYQEGWITQKP